MAVSAEGKLAPKADSVPAPAAKRSRLLETECKCQLLEKFIIECRRRRTELRRHAILDNRKRCLPKTTLASGAIGSRRGMRDRGRLIQQTLQMIDEGCATDCAWRCGQQRPIRRVLRLLRINAGGIYGNIRCRQGDLGRHDTARLHTVARAGICRPCRPNVITVLYRDGPATACFRIRGNREYATRKWTRNSGASLQQKHRREHQRYEGPRHWAAR